MRHLARIGLAMLGLAVATPVAVWAGPPVTTSTGAPRPAHKHRKTLFGKEKLCVDCQRAQLRAQGVEMPAPPPLPQGVVMEGGVCTTCQTVPGTVVGTAVVGGESAPGYAVVGGPMPGAEPAPIGVVQARLGGPVPRGAAPTDRSVMPTRMVPPPADPVAPAGSNRPHIFSHVFGLSAIGRDWREEAHRKEGQKHASIRYGEDTQKVSELPASMVYGRTWWGGDPR